MAKRTRDAAFDKDDVVETLPSLDTAVWAHILSFAWPDDLWSASRTSEWLEASCTQALASATASLHFSTLRRHQSSPISNEERDDCIETILSLPPCLEKLVRLDLYGLSYWCGEGLTNDFLAVKAPNLETLILSGCIRFPGTVLEQALQYYQSNDSKNHTACRLKHLHLDGCTSVTQRILQILADKLPQLQTLSIAGCSQSIRQVPKFPHLETMNVSGLDQLQLLVTTYHQSWPKLKSFTAIGCRRIRIGHDPQQQLTTGDDDLPCIPLERLNLNQSGAAITTRTHPLNRGGVLGNLVSMSCSMREVHVSGCNNFTDVDMNALVVYCANTLQSLTLRGCGRVSGRGLESCRRLVALDISTCNQMGDAVVMAVATHCQQLRTLRLAHLTALTDASLTAIGNHLSHLLVLDIQGCINLNKCERLPPRLIELEASETSIAFQHFPLTLKIQSRRLLPRSTEQVVHEQRQRPYFCCASFQSQRCRAPQVSPRPMWQCRDCQLTDDRGMCQACADRCHEGHDKYLATICTFYCDCAFGLGKNVECGALLNVNAAPDIPLPQRKMFAYMIGINNC